MKPLIKFRLLFFTILFSAILVAGFTYTEYTDFVNNIEPDDIKSKIYGKQHGVDPTPLPPEPLPNKQTHRKI